MIVTFDDIIETRVQVLGRGETIDHIELTEAALDNLKSEMESSSESVSVPEVPDDAIGRVQSVEIIEGDTNAIVTERGAKYRL